jgi:hypothetical protein
MATPVVSNDAEVRPSDEDLDDGHGTAATGQGCGSNFGRRVA